MSIWKEVKHALNSTLGTKNFQPLDQYLRSTKTINMIVPKDTENLLYHGKTYLYCNPKLKESFQELHPNYVVFDISDKDMLPLTLFKIKMLNAGSIMIANLPTSSGLERGEDARNGWYSAIRIDVAGTIITPNYNSYFYTNTGGVHYNKGDIIHVYIKSTNATMRNDSSSSNITFTPCIYGEVKDTSAFEYINWEEVSE